MQIQSSTALNTGVQPHTDEITDPFADLDEESEDEQEGDSGSQDEELQELVQQFEPELNASDYWGKPERAPQLSMRILTRCSRIGLVCI